MPNILLSQDDADGAELRRLSQDALGKEAVLSPYNFSIARREESSNPRHKHATASYEDHIAWADSAGCPGAARECTTGLSLCDQWQSLDRCIGYGPLSYHVIEPLTLQADWQSPVLFARSTRTPGHDPLLLMRLYLLQLISPWLSSSPALLVLVHPVLPGFIILPLSPLSVAHTLALPILSALDPAALSDIVFPLCVYYISLSGHPSSPTAWALRKEHSLDQPNSRTSLPLGSHLYLSFSSLPCLHQQFKPLLHYPNLPKPQSR